jgi:hypothetical protein
VLGQAVKRNINRFPSDFMFRLSKDEFEDWKSQNVTSSWGGRRTIPFAFRARAAESGDKNWIIRKNSSVLACQLGFSCNGNTFLLHFFSEIA